MLSYLGRHCQHVPAHPLNLLSQFGVVAVHRSFLNDEIVLKEGGGGVPLDDGVALPLRTALVHVLPHLVQVEQLWREANTLVHLLQLQPKGWGVSFNCTED